MLDALSSGVFPMAQATSQSRRDHRRRRHPLRLDRRLRVEPLEDRRLLSLPGIPTLTAPEATASEAWQVGSSPGQEQEAHTAWFARFAGIAGPADQQVGAIRDRIRYAGPDVQVRRSLGTDGLVLITTPPMSREQLGRELGGVPGYQYVAPAAV